MSGKEEKVSSSSKKQHESCDKAASQKLNSQMNSTLNELAKMSKGLISDRPSTSKQILNLSPNPGQHSNNAPNQISVSNTIIEGGKPASTPPVPGDATRLQEALNKNDRKDFDKANESEPVIDEVERIKQKDLHSANESGDRSFVGDEEYSDMITPTRRIDQNAAPDQPSGEGQRNQSVLLNKETNAKENSRIASIDIDAGKSSNMQNKNDKVCSSTIQGSNTSSIQGNETITSLKNDSIMNNHLQGEVMAHVKSDSNATGVREKDETSVSVLRGASQNGKGNTSSVKQEGMEEKDLPNKCGINFEKVEQVSTDNADHNEVPTYKPTISNESSLFKRQIDEVTSSALANSVFLLAATLLAPVFATSLSKAVDRLIPFLSTQVDYLMEFGPFSWNSYS